MRPRRWWAESVPLGGNRVKVSENKGATAVPPVAPVDTSLKSTLDKVNKQTHKEFFGVGGSAIFRSSEVKKVQEIL